MQHNLRLEENTMKELTIGQAQRMTAPAPFALLASADKDGKTNLMAVSWWTYLSNRPPKLGACLSNKGYSGGNIREGGEFALCIVDEELSEAALKCGGCSGRDTDKAQQFGIELMDAKVVTPKVVKASKVIFECKLAEAVDIGDHTFYVADIVSVYGDEDKKQLYAYDGYGRLATAIEG